MGDGSILGFIKQGDGKETLSIEGSESVFTDLAYYQEPKVSPKNSAVIPMRNLTARTIYSYTVKCKDVDGNCLCTDSKKQPS